MKQILTGILLLLFAGSNLYSTNFIPFERLESHEGLSLVKDIYRDDNDFLWIATDGFGLKRYDSYQMKSFVHNPNDLLSLSNDNVTKIFEDSRKNLWVATFSGLDLFNRKTEKFHNYLNFEGRSTDFTSQYVNDIVEDNYGRLWIASGNGLYEYRYAEDTMVFYKLPFEDPRLSNLKNLSLDKDGNIWISSIAPTVCKFIPESQKFEIFEFEELLNFTITSTSVLVDSDNKVWLGFGGFGLAIFDPVTGKTNYVRKDENGKGLSNVLVMSIEEFYQGKIYIATDQGGINIFDKQTNKFTYINSKNKNAGNLSSDGIYCLYRDREGILWVGTSRGGINFYNPKKHRFNNMLEANNIKSYFSKGANITHGVVGTFLEDTKGNIWIGTNGGGLNKYNPKTGDVKIYTTRNSGLSTDIIARLSEDSNGDILIATWPEAVHKLIVKEDRIIQLNFISNYKVGFVHNILWSVMVDKKDRIWIDFSEGHVIVLDKNRNEIAKRIITPDPVHYFNESGYIKEVDKYYNNNPEGIFWLNEATMEFEPFIERGDIFCFKRDSRGNYWTGTLKSGAFCYNNKGELLFSLNTDNGLSNNTVYAIETSDEGAVWLATNNGLNEFSYSDSTIFSYYESDGLQSNQYFMQASLKTRNGQIFFGGTEGIDYFYPKEIQRNNFLPKVHLNEMLIRNNSGEEQNVLSANRDTADIIRLSWNENRIVFKYFAINYTFQEKTRYKYKLAGIDTDEWIITGLRQATYTNLKPGKYTFSVMASNNDGIWNNEVAEISFAIEAPFWLRIWFYFVCVLVLAFFVYLSMQWRERSLIRDKENLRRNVQERTRVIEAQKEELVRHRNELNMHKEKLEDLVKERTKELEEAKIKAENSDRLKSHFLANLSHEIRTPMNAIVGFSTLLKDPQFEKEEKRSFIDTIIDNSNSLMVLIEDILDFSLIEAGQLRINIESFSIIELIKDVHSTHSINAALKQINLKIVNELSEDLEIKSDKYRIRQILNNLVSNAIKFTNEGTINIGVKLDDDILKMYVQDSGIGIDEKQKEYIFGQFVKLDRDQTSKRGIGLGLAISRRLSKLLGGSLTVESVPGTGSTFVLAIPIEYIKVDKKQQAKEIKKINEKPDWNGKRVLIVEDEEDNYVYLQTILLKTNAHITIAKDGLEAVEIFKANNNFDLVLMDIKMPRMNGYEAMRQIKAINPNQIIVAQTAYAQPNDEIKIREQGFTNYISKPIRPNALFDLLSLYFNS